RDEARLGHGADPGGSGPGGDRDPAAGRERQVVKPEPARQRSWGWRASLPRARSPYATARRRRSSASRTTPRSSGGTGHTSAATSAGGAPSTMAWRAALEPVSRSNAGISVSNSYGSLRKAKASGAC